MLRRWAAGLAVTAAAAGALVLGAGACPRRRPAVRPRELGDLHPTHSRRPRPHRQAHRSHQRRRLRQGLHRVATRQGRPGAGGRVPGARRSAHRARGRATRPPRRAREAPVRRPARPDDGLRDMSGHVRVAVLMTAVGHPRARRLPRRGDRCAHRAAREPRHVGRSARRRRDPRRPDRKADRPRRRGLVRWPHRLLGPVARSAPEVGRCRKRRRVAGSCWWSRTTGRSPTSSACTCAATGSACRSRATARRPSRPCGGCGPPRSCSTSGFPGWTASRSAGGCAPRTTGRRCCSSPLATTRSTASSAWRWAPTTT